ncbi:MAG TPA: hypothetical protein VGD83_08260, partial [Streptosporangiaceae bacterium]
RRPDPGSVDPGASRRNGMGGMSMTAASPSPSPSGPSPVLSGARSQKFDWPPARLPRSFHG